jgi:hypothetical protein
MNLQTESRPTPKPPAGIDPLKAVAREWIGPMSSEPSEADAYGCVEWFNYEKHPLGAAARVKAKKA